MTEIKICENWDFNLLFEMMDWCDAQFGECKIDDNNRWIGGRWRLGGSGSLNASWSFTFTHSDDALIFTLKWML